MEEMKYFTVVIEGIDKCGKSLIADYVWRLNKSLNVFPRGYISLEVYNRKFNRGKKYVEPYKDALYVLLTVNKEDWEIRCAINNEPKINFEEDSKLFQDVFNELDRTYRKMTFNTSEQTAFNIAKEIVKMIELLNAKCIDPKEL